MDMFRTFGALRNRALYGHILRTVTKNGEDRVTETHRPVCTKPKTAGDKTDLESGNIEHMNGEVWGKCERVSNGDPL